MMMMLSRHILSPRLSPSSLILSFHHRVATSQSSFFSSTSSSTLVTSTSTTLGDNDAEASIRASASMSVPMSSSWKGVSRFYTSVSVDKSPCGTGFVVLIDGRALRTNAAAELVLPSRALAGAIAGEFAVQRERILPATQPLYNLASTAVDTYASEDAAGAADYEALLRATRLAAFDRITETRVLTSARELDVGAPAHASLESGRGGGTMSSDATAGTAKLRDLMLDTLETDTVCFRVDEGNDPADKQLRKKQNKYYDPLQAWFSRSFGVTIGTAVGFNELLHSESAYMAIEDIVDTASPWFKAAMGAAVGASKSSIVSLALVHGAIDSSSALDASRLEEEWQISQNGLVEDGHDTSRSTLRLNLSSIAAFIGLLPPSARGAPLADTNKADKVTLALEARLARVVARRAKEDKLVEHKRKIMRSH